MNRTKSVGLAKLVAALTIPSLVLQAADPIPLTLPRPDGKPGNATKPVKVYLLAGQSNMVGMGDISGARPLYTSILLSADPRVIPGNMPIGGAGLAAHGVFQSADTSAAKGAKVSLFHGAYDPKTDYAKLTPAKTATVALGSVSEKLPAMDGPHIQVVRAFINVPANGNYTVHAGFEDSTHAVVILDGKEVYRKEVGGKPAITKVALETGNRYPVTITYFKGGSAAFWLEQIEIEGKGDLVTLTKKDKRFQYLLDDQGKWTVRNDVFYKEARLHPESAGSALSATSNNGASIGPELGFGYVMGTFHDEQVLLIKTAQGNRSLGFDFRPPSSGRTDVSNQFESLEYQLMVKGVRETLDKIDKVVPGYQGQGYEIAGFGWFQGHKDSGAPKAEYEKHLVNLISDLRKEFKAPKMPVVVATVGFNGYRLESGPWNGVWEAQMAVGDPKQHPEFSGTVASVDTRDFWREVEESPRGQDYHYNRNPETYLLVGEAMGRAVVRMLGGEAEAIPKSDREARTAARVAAEAAKLVPTAEQKAASLAALKPMILDGALAAFLVNPRNQPLLQTAVKGEKPARVSPLLGDTLDEAVSYYQAAGIRDHDWKPFGGDLKGSTWDYFCFDLPETLDKTKGINDLKMTCPSGMENWFALNFDAKKAGWQSGEAPFGGEKDTVKYPEWYGPSKRTPPKTVCEKDVLLLRQSFDLPPLKEGYRYRIMVGGSAHANSGEGYAIYVNGKLLADSKGGVVAWRREGGKPRGGHVWAGFRDEFKGGKVTIAVSNFPMNNRSVDGFIPARSPLSVWLEEMKTPPVGQ
jgi:alpha-galactosidase